MAEQRNPYRGGRAWLRLGFRAADGTVRQLDLVADTGCPAAVMLRPDLYRLFCFMPQVPRTTNFGQVPAGWLQLSAPELGIVETVLGFASNEAARLAERSHPDFVGLVGLPILRLGEYGGNADAFWFRYPPQPTSTP